MNRTRRILAVWISTVLLAALAACSSPSSQANLGDEAASRLLSSSFRLSSGSVRVSGFLRGVSGDSVLIQAATLGGYPVQCKKDQGNMEPQGQFKIADSTNGEDVAAKKGAVRLGEKKNEEEFIMVTPAPGDPNEACPSDNNWVGEFTGPFYDDGVVPVWIVTDVFLRWSQDPQSLEPTWTPVSWTCSPGTKVDDVDTCMEDVEPRSDIDWNLLFSAPAL